jgi:polyisoprenoid-binding protein YceI
MFAAAAILLASLPAATSFGQAAELYVVDPAHTSVVFSVGHAQLSYTYGFFRRASGQYILDRNNAANCRFRFAIETDSLDTNHSERDTHLRSADFFNVPQFPAITFESTSCTLADSDDGRIVYEVTGNLAIHGVTRRVTVPLVMLGEGLGPFKDRRSGFLCQTELKRSDFGMNNRLDVVGDAVGVTISFEGKLQQGSAGTAPANADSRSRQPSGTNQVQAFRPSTPTPSGK